MVQKNVMRDERLRIVSWVSNAEELDWRGGGLLPYLGWCGAPFIGCSPGGRRAMDTRHCIDDVSDLHIFLSSFSFIVDCLVVRKIGFLYSLLLRGPPERHK